MEIVSKKVLAETRDTRITEIEVKTPEIAAKAKPGQFVVLMVKEEGERIPLTVVDTDSDSGIIKLVFQELGLTTKLLGKLNTGESLYAIVGSLGNSTEIKKYGKVILIGGGVGIAEIYPVARALKEEGNRITTILGARTKDLLILEEELKRVSDEFYITTDDGSYGRKGFTTDILKEIASAPPAPRNDIKYDLIYAVGPIPMMQRVSHISKEFKIKTMVSLNALMVDATGMCGCCRVRVAGKVRFSCIDGPEFDGHEVDWEELEKRSRIYSDKEEHICNLSKL